MSIAKHFDFRRLPAERRDGRNARRKEDLALLLAAINLKMLADHDAPREQLVQQIDYLHDLVDQVMQKHRPQQDVPGATDTDAAHESRPAA